MADTAIAETEQAEQTEPVDVAVEEKPEATASAVETDPVMTKARKVVDKEPSGLHKHYVGWLQDKTNWAPESATLTDFEKIIQLAISLYHDYQASPERVQHREDERAQANAAKTAAVQEREKAKAVKAAERAAAAETKKKAAEAAAAAKRAEAEAAGDAEGSDTPPTKKTPAKKAPAKGAKSTTPVSAEAPF